MKKQLLTAAVLALFLEGRSQSLLPEVIISSGGSGKSSRAQLSWTVGEPFVGTFSSATASLTQGFFYQPKPLVTAVNDPQASFLLQVYPNPASTRLTISASGLAGRHQLRLIDAVGRERLSFPFSAGVEKEVYMDIAFLPDGIYYLQLLNTASKTVRVFKVVIAK